MVTINADPANSVSGASIVDKSILLDWISLSKYLLGLSSGTELRYGELNRLPYSLSYPNQLSRSHLVNHPLFGA